MIGQLSAGKHISTVKTHRRYTIQEEKQLVKVQSSLKSEIIRFLSAGTWPSNKCQRDKLQRFCAQHSLIRVVAETISDRVEQPGLKKVKISLMNLKSKAAWLN